MRLLLSLSVALLLTASQARAQVAAAPFGEIQPVAQKALKTFSRFVTKENYRQMGFEDPEEVRTATLGAPLQDFIVRLDKLKNYAPGGRLDELLTATDQVVYPVLVKGRVRSSITISKTGGSWQAVSFGGPNFIKLISGTLEENTKATRLASSEYQVVRVPSLNLFFLGFRLNNELMFVPVADNARLKFRAGAGIKAENVFSAILPEASAHDGLPR
ncbi:MAG: hypothetical protein Q7R35_05015 [Elusimicrobiota bacterium]|nr:hypothetical protein [Elusimicrobiota bacterium]